MGDAQQRFRRRIVLPIALVAAAMIVAVVLLTFGFAQRQTSDAIAQQRSLAESMLSIRGTELEKLASDYSYWDEAFEKLVTELDLAWADANIGTGLANSHGVDMTFVLDPAGRTTYSMTNGARSYVAVDHVLRGGIAELLKARQDAGPNATRSGLLVTDGTPVLVSVSPLRPFARPDTATVDARHILIFADLLDEAQLARLAGIYQLPGLHVVPAADASAASFQIRTFDGNVSTRLAWEGADPGARMLRDLLPVILAVLVVFAILNALVLRQTELSVLKLELSERRASHDVLTGLRNRSALLDHLDDGGMAWPELSDGYALLYVDLDGFKTVNDDHGHNVGDEVLVAAAQRLEAACPMEGRVYRLGGDEFAVLVPGIVAPDELRKIGSRIVQELAEPFLIGRVECRIGATVGVATATDPQQDVLDVLRRADQALYLGKRMLKGTVRFHVDVAHTANRAS